MRGQWFGQYSGTNSGNITIELDETENAYVGWAYLYEGNSDYPCSAAEIDTKSKFDTMSFSVRVTPLNPYSGLFMSPQDLKKAYPDIIFPNSADVTFKICADILNIHWNTNIGTSGVANLPRSRAEDKSELIANKVTTWEEFKRLVSKLQIRDFIFRGQRESSKWRLRTSFYRSGRADLRRYTEIDIRQLHASTINLFSHKFDLDNQYDLAAFYALLQHHGYPTPFQDWSFSPYVAAYFAFSEISKKPVEQDGECRIFILAARSFNKRVLQFNGIEGIEPHFSLIEPLAIENQRMFNQQGFFAITNVDDIETYMKRLELLSGTEYLMAIDLPKNLRAEVMADLERMGITAASLFPGIDGTCKFQKERLF